ncbi:MAG: hypothetical protein M9924_21950 [Rhizobiaceae bacterium]|nr:hypothetical protein [Rhizobiaceae bacterium]
MKPLRYLLPAIAGAVISLTAHGAKAQDASFGCKILLCVASQNPSWQGVPYCVPPVLKLLAIRKVHPGYWPSCPEAGTGKPGYAQYEDCPQGWSPYSAPGDRPGQFREAARCRIDASQLPQSVSYNRQRYGGGDGGSIITATVQIDGKPIQAHIDRVFDDGRGYRTNTYLDIPRPRRPDPWYFDIRNKDTGKVQRFFFNLRH